MAVSVLAGLLHDCISGRTMWASIDTRESTFLQLSARSGAAVEDHVDLGGSLVRLDAWEGADAVGIVTVAGALRFFRPPTAASDDLTVWLAVFDAASRRSGGLGVERVQQHPAKAVKTPPVAALPAALACMTSFRLRASPTRLILAGRTPQGLWQVLEFSRATVLLPTPAPLSAVMREHDRSYDEAEVAEVLRGVGSPQSGGGGVRPT